MAMLAYEDAVEHYEAALRTLGQGDERERCKLLLRLGAAQRESVLVSDARQTFASAAELARGRWPELLAAAALGYVGAGLGGVWWYAYGQADPTLIELLREALAALGPDAPSLRAQVLARLATELYFSPARDEATALSREAAEIARGLGDGQTLIRALTALHIALWVPAGLVERAQIADELVELAERLGHPELEMSGRAWRLTDSLELGDIDAVDAEIDACARIAEDRPHPVHAWYATLFRASRALVDGRFDDAERLAAAAHAAGAIEPVQNADQAFALQTFALRCEQGRLPELLEAVEAMVEAHPAVVAWRCAYAYVLAEAGDDAAARSALDQLAADRFGAIPTDSSWLGSLAVLARACEATGHAVHAPALYELLLPYARHIVVAGFGLASFGTVAHHLGLLAATMGRADDARAHFEDALAMADAMRARPWRARTERALALL
jgi:hypothetical protein